MVGDYAGYGLTTAERCIFIGNTAGYTGTTTGDKNTGIGDNTLRDISSGHSCTAVGSTALQDVTTGTQNTAMGHEAQQNVTTGQGNASIGHNTLNSCTTGGSNSAIGNTALGAVTTGSNNFGIGNDAGRSNSAANITTHSNHGVLGNSSMTFIGAQVSLTVSSDQRDKTDITDFTKGLDIINALRPVTYVWDQRSDYSDDLSVTPDGTHKKSKLNLGLLAQEVHAVEKANGYGNTENDYLFINLSEDGEKYGMQYERLVPVLINAVKELSAEVQALKAA